MKSSQLGYMTSINGFISTPLSLIPTKIDKMIDQHALPYFIVMMTSLQLGHLTTFYRLIPLFSTSYKKQTLEERRLARVELTLQVMVLSLQIIHVTSAYGFIFICLSFITTKQRYSNQTGSIADQQTRFVGNKTSTTCLAVNICIFITFSHDSDFILTWQPMQVHASIQSYQIGLFKGW